MKRQKSTNRIPSGRALIDQLCREAGCTKNDMAREMGVSRRTVDRLRYKILESAFIDCSLISDWAAGRGIGIGPLELLALELQRLGEEE